MYAFFRIVHHEMRYKNWWEYFRDTVDGHTHTPIAEKDFTKTRRQSGDLKWDENLNIFFQFLEPISKQEKVFLNKIARIC